MASAQNRPAGDGDASSRSTSSGVISVLPRVVSSVIHTAGAPDCKTISAASGSDPTLYSAYSVRLPQIPALHPQAQRLAKDAIALLQTAFRVSQELMCIDAHASEQDAPEGTYRYFLQETWQPARMRCSYGLLGQQRQSGCWTTLAVISPFSDDRAAVERLAKLCTAQQLDPVHLFDVIHDFLDQEAATV